MYTAFFNPIPMRCASPPSLKFPSATSQARLKAYIAPPPAPELSAGFWRYSTDVQEMQLKGIDQ